MEKRTAIMLPVGLGTIRDFICGTGYSSDGTLLGRSLHVDKYMYMRFKDKGLENIQEQGICVCDSRLMAWEAIRGLRVNRSDDRDAFNSSDQVKKSFWSY